MPANPRQHWRKAFGRKTFGGCLQGCPPRGAMGRRQRALFRHRRAHVSAAVAFRSLKPFLSVIAQSHYFFCGYAVSAPPGNNA